MSDEAELVRRAMRGDAEAHGQLVLRHTQAVRSITRSFGADWEDVAQETFLRAYAQLRSLKDPAQVGDKVEISYYVNEHYAARVLEIEEREQPRLRRTDFSRREGIRRAALRIVPESLRGSG